MAIEDLDVNILPVYVIFFHIYSGNSMILKIHNLNKTRKTKDVNLNVCNWICVTKAKTKYVQLLNIVMINVPWLHSVAKDNLIVCGILGRMILLKDPTK